MTTSYGSTTRICRNCGIKMGMSNLSIHFNLPLKLFLIFLATVYIFYLLIFLYNDGGNLNLQHKILKHNYRSHGDINNNGDVHKEEFLLMRLIRKKFSYLFFLTTNHTFKASIFHFFIHMSIYIRNKISSIYKTFKCVPNCS